MGYLVDSNVLIDYVAERFEPHQLQALDLIFDHSLQISVITKIEILGYNSTLAERTKMINFISYSSIIKLDDDIVDKTIDLKKLIKIKTPDAIIAATSLVSNLTLITHNISDFKRVADLQLLNPYEI